MLAALSQYAIYGKQISEIFLFPTTLIGGGFALFVFYRTSHQFMSQMRSNHYSELDSMFKEILLIAIEKPYLRDKTQIAIFSHYLGSQINPPAYLAPKCDRITRERLKLQAAQYDMYAFIVFNFLETIHDRCYETRDWKNRLDQSLVGTWIDIIGSEHRLHEDWFDLELRICQQARASGDLSRGSKFCFGFRDFVLRQPWLVERHQGATFAKAWQYRDENKHSQDYELLLERRFRLSSDRPTAPELAAS
ncbi:MAG: hypothetical protein KF842_13270 [Caulobacter sp.]|nr:hypothetical protein [Caulobacter sp.]